MFLALASAMRWMMPAARTPSCVRVNSSVPGSPSEDQSCDAPTRIGRPVEGGGGGGVVRLTGVVSARAPVEAMTWKLPPVGPAVYEPVARDRTAGGAIGHLHGDAVAQGVAAVRGKPRGGTGAQG